MVVFKSTGQQVSFCHQCTAADPPDSRRTPTQRVNEHLLGVQRVTRSQSCNRACQKKLASLIVTTTTSSQENLEKKKMPRVDVDVAYSTRLHSRKSQTQAFSHAL